MKNIKITFSYDGSKFNGWHGDSNNKNCIYIQDQIEKALRIVFKENIKAICAGRTDSGVHGLKQVCHFKIPYEYSLYKLQQTIEHFAQISIREIIEVDLRFHARYSAKQREYMYIVSYEKSPLLYKKTFYSQIKWDLNKLQQVCDFLLEQKNLAFFAPYSYTGSTYKHLDYCYFKREKLLEFETLNIYIGSKSFFYHQIRNIVGCMLTVCVNEWSLEEFKNQFYTQDRKNCPSMISASGLYFTNVKY